MKAVLVLNVEYTPLSTPLDTTIVINHAQTHHLLESAIMEILTTRWPQITATTALVTYAHTRHKLTPAGILAGILVAGIHMLHPWPAFFWLLIIFFVLGTGVTRVGKKVKAGLTISYSGGKSAKVASAHGEGEGEGEGGEGARTSTQVFANSGWACVLILLHTWLLNNSTPFTSSLLPLSPGPYFPALAALLPIGIIAQYAAVAADTFSSELGILAKTKPFLITAPWRRVPAGTNGGVTVDGVLYGGLGGALLTITAAAALRVLPPYIGLDVGTMGLLTLSGLVGTVLDSVLGALVQATVTDGKSGKVVEGHGGQRVVVGGSRVRMGGVDLLTNNGVNFVMAMVTSVAAMGTAYVSGVGTGR
ncbi:hypothetical protein LTR62_007639 [Meristemomyces frigidus]|uniref:DUF92 domain protein n=1 Tax=Meristemomyces frigidus TaxID=1508187 RepID=A0AAN7TAY7_9PEZI|nr:hypothetical protein LTR62_007639 [Meristemomyces frigidus]